MEDKGKSEEKDMIETWRTVRRYGDKSDRPIQDRDIEDKKVDDRDNNGRWQEILMTVTWREMAGTGGESNQENGG
jgi:hypothetical protein